MKAALFVVLFAFVLSCIPTTASAQGVECVICEFVVKQVENFVANNATETEILQKLDGACMLLVHTSWIATCKTLVNTEGARIIQYVINDETPAVACSEIGMCNATLVAPPMKNVGSDIECGVCSYLVGVIESYVANNTTETEILTFIEKDCGFLINQNWIATCKGTVATFGPEIIKLVIDKQPAPVVCAEIGLCNSSRTAVAPAKQAPIKQAPAKAAAANGTLECEICQFLVSYTEKFIAENKTESEIIDELSLACDVLIDTTWVSECKSLVVEYGDLIVAYLVNEEPPAVVCGEIKLCTSESKPALSRPKGDKLKL